MHIPHPVRGKYHDNLHPGWNPQYSHERTISRSHELTVSQAGSDSVVKEGLRSRQAVGRGRPPLADDGELNDLTSAPYDEFTFSQAGSDSAGRES